VSAAGPAGSCPSCHSWGALYAGACRSCYDFARRHEPGPCGACRRERPLKEGHCRNCWLQAALQAAGTARRAPDLGPADFAAVRHHQLSFAGVARLNRRPRLPRPDGEPVPAGPPGPRWEQLELSVPGQSRLFHSRHWAAASVSNPALEQARAIASRLGEARGWNPRVQDETRRALAVMLASHVHGEKIPWSFLEPALRPRDLSVSRAAEILGLAGLLDDDRVRPLDTWIEGKLATLAPGIAACARSWAQALQHGTSRSLPRSPDTARIYLRSARPLLEQWSARYDHLREVTVGDAAAAIAALRGHQRRKTLTALRSLTRHCKKTGLIFADPAARIRSAPRPEMMILPLTPARISTATEAAATPAARLTLALAAVRMFCDSQTSGTPQVLGEPCGCPAPTRSGHSRSASLDQASSTVTPGRSLKRALASRVSTRRPVSAACAAMIRSCAPRGLPDLRTWASRRAWCAAVTWV
jgi:hypothetical protein